MLGLLVTWGREYRSALLRKLLGGFRINGKEWGRVQFDLVYNFDFLLSWEDGEKGLMGWMKAEALGSEEGKGFGIMLIRFF